MSTSVAIHSAGTTFSYFWFQFDQENDLNNPGNSAEIINEKLNKMAQGWLH